MLATALKSLSLNQIIVHLSYTSIKNDQRLGSADKINANAFAPMLCFE